jgi:hypothetical protein
MNVNVIWETALIKLDGELVLFVTVENEFRAFGASLDMIL